eukprot:6191950-Pleurochrysis_carterae.AAC.2
MALTLMLCRPQVITGPLTTTISHEGILAVYNKLSAEDKVVFKQAYCASYMPARSIIEECYDTVACGNEIRDVVNAVKRFDRYPMGIIDATRTWQARRHFFSIFVRLTAFSGPCSGDYKHRSRCPGCCF